MPKPRLTAPTHRPSAGTTKNRSVGYCRVGTIVPILRPMVTGLPFFSTFFCFIANFGLFCRNGKSSVVTAQPFLLLPPRVITIYHAGNPYLCYGAKIILPPPTQYPPPCLPPPPPRHPVAAETLAVLVGGVNYILPLNQRALLPPDAKRPARIY